MFPRTRGPSRNPVCAATKRSAASATRSVRTSAVPTAMPPIFQCPKSASKSTQFIVFPSCARAPTRRYPNRMPPAVKASDTAMRNIVVLAGLHARLAQHRHAVRDGLDTGVGAAAHRVRAEKNERERPEAHRRLRRLEVARRSREDGRELGDMNRERVEDRESVRPDEDEEDRGEERDRFLDAPEIEDDEEDEDDDLGRQLVARHPGPEEVPDLVAGRRDGHRDRENVVHEEGAARDDAGLPARGASSRRGTRRLRPESSG